MINYRLKDKYVLVTGGSHGIGKAISIGLAKEGCNVAVCARDAKRINEVVKEIEKEGVKGVGIQCDVLIKEDINKVIYHIKDKWGTLDILINNIGGGGRWGTEVYEDFFEWDEVYEKNAGVARKLTMAFIPNMRKNKWGRIVTIASIFGKEVGGRPWFNMAKAAEISLMKNLAGKYSGITFNTVAPGHIDIGTKEFTGLGKPDDVVGIVVFLCSDKAKHINGACITVDGGESRSF